LIKYFGFKFGKLQYRPVRWKNEIKNIENYHGEAIINYPGKMFHLP